MRLLKRGNNNTKRLVYTALVRPILEYGAVCWDPYREGQVRALNRVQRRAANLQITPTIRVGRVWHSVE
jgi:ribosomal protein L15E